MLLVGIVAESRIRARHERALALERDIVELDAALHAYASSLRGRKSHEWPENWPAISGSVESATDAVRRASIGVGRAKGAKVRRALEQIDDMRLAVLLRWSDVGIVPPEPLPTDEAQHLLAPMGTIKRVVFGEGADVDPVEPRLERAEVYRRKGLAAGVAALSERTSAGRLARIRKRLKLTRG